MPFKAITLFLVIVCALLAPVKSAPTFHSLNVRQYYGQNVTTNSTNDPPSTPTNTNTSDPTKQEGLAAQKMNAEFATIKETDPCQDGQMACVNSSFAQCVGGKWKLSPCSSPDLSCYVLPRDDKPGLSLVCDTPTNAIQRFVSAGLQGGVTGNDNTTTTASGGNPDDDSDCDDNDDGTGANTTQGGTDDSGDDCDDQNDSTSSVIASATPKSVPSSTGVSAVRSQASNNPITTTITLPTTTGLPTLQRRQFLSLTSSSTSSAVTTSSVPTLIPSSTLPSSVPVITSSVATPSPSTNGIVTPTVVVGTNNIVTVTVVSTVTVSATNCAVTGATASPAAISATDAPSTLVSSIGTAFTLPTGSAAASTSLPAPTSISATTSLSTTSISSSSPGIPTSSVSISSSATATAAGAFGPFSFVTPGVTTSAPQNTATGTPDISQLLTATI